MVASIENDTPIYAVNAQIFSPFEIEGSFAKISASLLEARKGKSGPGYHEGAILPQNPLPVCFDHPGQEVEPDFKFRTLNHMRKKIKEHIGDEDYIVQQGIELASYKDRPFDLRILVQKNIQGKWSITGIGARVAGSLSITTHVPRRGSRRSQAPAHQCISSGDGEKNIARVKKTALSIARQMERGSGRRHGEMSIDIGVDKSGHVSFFEANSKPMKFDEPEIRRKSLQKLIEYGYYLYTRSFQTQSRTRK